MRGRLASVVVGLVVVAPVLALSGCGQTITAPDVVGMRLDDAHRTFEKMGVDNFEDVDVIGDDRTSFIDHNWVVLRQVPSAGTTEVDDGATVRLEIGAVDDDDIIDRLPADSPVAEELRKKIEAEAAEKEEASEEQQELAAQQAAEEALIGTRPASDWALPDREGCADPAVVPAIQWEGEDVANVKRDRVDTRWSVADVAIDITNDSEYEIRVTTLFLRVKRPIAPAPKSYRRGNTFSSAVNSYSDDITIAPGETVENSGLLLSNLSDWYDDYFSLRAPAAPSYSGSVLWSYADPEVHRDCLEIPARSHRLLDDETSDGLVSARYTQRGLRATVKTCATSRRAVLDVGAFYAKNEREETIDAQAIGPSKLPVAKGSCRTAKAIFPGVGDSTWAVRRYLPGDELPTQWFLDGL